jgi:prefoldin subunit 5
MIGRSDSEFDTQQMEQDIQIIERDIQSIQESLNGIIYHLKEVQNAKE